MSNTSCGVTVTFLEGGGISWDTFYRAATSLLEGGGVSWDTSYRAATSLLEGGGISWDTSYRAATPYWRVEESPGTLPTELPHLAGGVSWDPSYGFTEMSSCMGMARTSLCKILCISDIITTVAGSQTLSFICQVYWRTW